MIEVLFLYRRVEQFWKLLREWKCIDVWYVWWCMWASVIVVRRVSRGTIPLTMATDFLTDLRTTIGAYKALGTEDGLLFVWVLEVIICDAVDGFIALQTIIVHNTVQHTVSHVLHVVGRGVCQVSARHCEGELHIVRRCDHADTAAGVGVSVGSLLVCPGQWHCHAHTFSLAFWCRRGGAVVLC